MNGKQEILSSGTVLYTGAGLPITTDTLLLAEFCPVKPKWNLCDLGCGSGLLMLSLIDRGLRGTVLGVEIDPEAILLLERAIEENGLGHQAHAVCANLLDFSHPTPFDLVVANPPYFTTGLQANTPQRATARHQLACSIGHVCATAYRLLKDGGRFCLCWPAEDVAPLFDALAANKLAPKRLQWVRRTPQDNARLALVEAHRHGGAGCKILPDKLLPPGVIAHF